MAPSRTSRSLKNISFGIILEAVTTCLSFVTRTCLVKWLGTGAVGINGLFTEVIGMIGMAEMGVGAAIVYNLYAPLANGDTKRVNQLMDLYKKAYHIIAAVTLVIGCALTPFIQNIVKKVDYSDQYVQTVFFLFVLKSAMSYVFSYKFSLLNADQKRYVQSLITLAVRVAAVVVQIIVLYVTKNYIYYLSVAIVQNLVVNLIGSHYVKKNYPYLKSGDKLPKEERRSVLKNIRFIFVKKLSGKITTSTDNILISMLVSTLVVGLYDNYVAVYSVIRQGCAQVSSGISGSMGNLMASETNENCADKLRNITFTFFSICFPATLCLFAGVDTVVTLWLGTEYLLEKMPVFLTCLIVGVEFLKMPLWQILEVSGQFHRDMWISIAGSGVNLVVSIVLGRIYGMTGIFIGTICTYVIQIALKIRLLFKHRLMISMKAYALDWCGYALAILLGMLAVSWMNGMIQTWAPWGRLVFQVATAGVASLVVLVLLWGRSKRFVYVKRLAVKMAGNIWNKVRRVLA